MSAMLTHQTQHDRILPQRDDHAGIGRLALSSLRLEGWV